MRIIAGEFRGRKLAPPDEAVTRPITDRAKQSLFDVLAPRIEGAVAYDLFAGTGSMGLECLSRGAKYVEFFEADRTALAGLRKNIAALKVGDRSNVRAGDLFKAFDLPPSPSPGIPGEGWDGSEHGAIGPHPTLPRHAGGGRPAIAPAGLIFLDPPYRFLRERPAELQKLASALAANHLAPDGVLIFRHDLADSLALPPLERFDLRTYGQMAIELLTLPVGAMP